MSLRFPAESITGVVAVIPTPSTAEAALPDAPFAVDLAETERATRAILRAGASAIMTNGSLGEMATLSYEEWRSFNEVVLATARAEKPDVPIFVGATTLSTRDTIARARTVQALGGHGLFLGRPFWCALDVAGTVSFYQAVAEAVPTMSIVLYDNAEAFKGPLATEAYAQLATVEQVVGVKYIALTPKFANDVRAIRGRFKVLPIEVDWLAARALFPEEISACWSSTIACGPEPVMALYRALNRGDLATARTITHKMMHAYEPFLASTNFPEFAKYNIVLEKVRYDEAGFVKAGPARHPYNMAPTRYVDGAREMARRWRALCAESIVAPARVSP